MSTFTEPINQNEIVEQIRNAPDIGTVYDIANRVFPNWIQHIFYHHCPNYPHLEQNWHYVCRINGFRPSQIILVNSLSDESDNYIMNIFLDVFYKGGFAVRLNQHYSACSKCMQYAVPLEFMYTKFIEHNITQLPSVWTSTCKFCNELDSEESD